MRFSMATGKQDKPKQNLEECDLIANGQVVSTKSTVDNTSRVTIDIEASDDFACAFVALLGRDKAAITIGIKVQ